MNQLLAFGKKEWMEQVRSGKIFILVILFCLFGIMNPAVAKLTPWMMEMMAESLAETGLFVNHIEVNAMTSWTQFYKNIPIPLIVVLVMFGGLLTGEIQKGTLIPIVTRGMKRWKIIACKSMVLLVLWTAGYLLCYGITYGYNAYFWDNGTVSNVFFGAFCFWLFGLWLLSLIPLGSGLFLSGNGVMLFAGAVFAVFYVAGMFPMFQDFLPTRLLSSAGLLTGAETPRDYTTAIVIAIVCMMIHEALAVVLFNRKNL